MNLEDFRFYVIYSATFASDISRKVLPSLHDFRPSRKLPFERTEWSDQYDLDWDFGKHGKYVGDLDFEQFSSFVEAVEIQYEDVETGGSITEMGWLPALSFEAFMNYYRGENVIVWLSAYVTPYLPDETLGESEWEQVRQLIKDRFS